MRKIALLVIILVPFVTMGQGYELNEIAPNFQYVPSDASGDVLWSLDVETITGDNQCLGCEFDGQYLWITGGNRSLEPNKLYKIDPFAGTLITSYDVPAQVGGWGLRDLCWIESEGLLYAGYESGFFSFDPATGNFVELFTGQSFGTIRALAFDGTYFWTKSFGNPLYQFDKSANIINSYPATDAAVVYGAAYDWNEGYLYLFNQTLAVFLQYTMDGVYTGVSYDISSFPGTVVAGGAFIDYGVLIPGKAILCGLIQGDPDTVVAIELYDYKESAVPLSPWVIVLGFFLIVGASIYSIRRFY